MMIQGDARAGMVINVGAGISLYMRIVYHECIPGLVPRRHSMAMIRIALFDDVSCTAIWLPGVVDCFPPGK